MLYALAQCALVPATPLDARVPPTLNHNFVHAIITVRSSQTPLATSSSRSKAYKGGKRRTSRQEVAASLRCRKHKEVEIKRRTKISSLLMQLTNELECGPTDTASVLLYALDFIKGAKRRYSGVELNSPTSMVV